MVKVNEMCDTSKYKHFEFWLIFKSDKQLQMYEIVYQLIKMDLTMTDLIT